MPTCTLCSDRAGVWSRVERHARAGHEFLRERQLKQSIVASAQSIHLQTHTSGGCRVVSCRVVSYRVVSCCVVSCRVRYLARQNSEVLACHEKHEAVSASASRVKRHVQAGSSPCVMRQFRLFGLLASLNYTRQTPCRST